jgi:hypothetical protein
MPLVTQRPVKGFTFILQTDIHGATNVMELRLHVHMPLCLVITRIRHDVARLIWSQSQSADTTQPAETAQEKTCGMRAGIWDDKRSIHAQHRNHSKGVSTRVQHSDLLLEKCCSSPRSKVVDVGAEMRMWMLVHERALA